MNLDVVITFVLFPLLTLVAAFTIFDSIRRFLRTRSMERITVGMIMAWGRNIDAAAAQIAKTYEWQIQQWSGFANSLLTATLSFISAVAASSFTSDFKINTRRLISLVILTLATSLLSYANCQQRISYLKSEFYHFYNLLLLLKKR